MMQRGRVPAIDVDEQLRRDQEARITRRMTLVPRVEFPEVREALADRVVQMARSSGRRLASFAVLRSRALRRRDRSRARAFDTDVLPPAARGTAYIPRGRLPALGWLVTSQSESRLSSKERRIGRFCTTWHPAWRRRGVVADTTLAGNPNAPAAAGQIEWASRVAFRPTFIANTGASELTRRTNRKLSSPAPQQATMPPHSRRPRLCITQCSVLQARVAPQLQARPGAIPPDVRAHAGFVPDRRLHRRRSSRGADSAATADSRARRITSGTVKECVGMTLLHHPEPGADSKCHALVPLFGVSRP